VGSCGASAHAPEDDGDPTGPLGIGFACPRPRSTRRIALSDPGGCGIVAGLSGAIDPHGASTALSRLKSATGSGATRRLAGDVMETRRCEVTCP